MSIYNRKKQRKARSLHIIIVGCGKVGNTLVERLIPDEHEITVIDQNAERIQQITDRFDISGVVGNGARFAVQSEAGVDTADILIAVTDSDELNLLCCVVAKRAAKCDVIARVRTPEYVQEADYLKEKLGLAMIINPDLQTAGAIARVLYMPTALSVNVFAGGQADMVRIKLQEGNALTGKKIMDLGSDRLSDVLICAVERGGEVVIPDGSFILQTGDVIVFIAQFRKGRSFLNNIGFQTHRVRDALLLGGGRCAYYLAKFLLEAGIEVTIIERDRNWCEVLSNELPQAVVINGDAANEELLAEAGIETVQAVVALTGFDEGNVFLTLHAREVSNAKLVTKVSRISFQQVIDHLDLGSVVYPQYITSEAIVAYVRTKTAQMHGDIETLVQLFTDRVEAIEFLVPEDSGVTGVPLSELRLKDQMLITCINRKGKIIIPRGHDMICPGDTVILVTTHKGIDCIDDALY
ncbi:MAG: Trk system potassium transporter TrkA [Lachnospiraceae bacterium]|nr:Trk system potassium transporter TrkA [Lachnospiraceae bacterium]